MSQVSPPAWLDKNFLETALAGSVDSFEVRTMGAVGDGYTSALLRVKVQLKSGKTENVVVKRLVQTNENSKFITETTMFDREILMYKETLPQLQKLLEKAFPGDVQPIAPRHFYSCDGTVVMEDLSASGFTMPDRREGMDLEHTLLLMRTAARFHAASVVLYQQVDPESMALYSKSIFSEAPINNMRKFFTGMTLLLADEVKKWPEYGEEYSKKLRAMAPKMLDLCIAGSKRDEKRFNVLTHDDLWINNIMLRGSTDIRFIDFQMPHFASPGNELHLILMSSLEDEVRRKHKDVLMKIF
ncbi:uncharacterized protein [Periplaneta americana]|uniref:uncharacterized protein isoform X4 n=1 Tax=Periplaneta americana TaxID=6978 RepID=UPI0037E8471A